MSAIVEAISDVVDSITDALEDLLKVVWDAIVEPILSEVFSWFGIEDETIVESSKISSKVYGNNAKDVVKAAITRAIFKKIDTDTSYFPNYMQEVYLTKGQIRAAYNYADRGQYKYDLPTSEVSGSSVDLVAIENATNDALGISCEIITAVAGYPSPGIYYKHELQADPYYYQPWDNTITENDPYGISWDDWEVGDVTYNIALNNYSVAISRIAADAQFWIDGPSQITEGDTAVYTVKSNRTLPIGQTVDINFTYTGTAVDGVDYTEESTVTMLAETSEVEVSIPTIETGNADRNFTITVDSIDNTGAFEMVTVHANNSVVTTITDDDTLKLTVNNILVNETNTTISVAVKLEQAAPSGAFTVDYNFTDLGATVGGVDYDNTTGTLNFAGTLEEVQYILIDIYADVADDDREQFQVWFDNSSDLDSIDISAVSTVTILDGTEDPAAANATLNHSITVPVFDREHSLTVTYKDYAEPDGQWRYWIYEYVEGTYTGIQEESAILKKLEMLPVVILRNNTVNVNANTSRSWYMTSKRIMSLLGLDIEEFVDALISNPDIDDVPDAYLNFSIGPRDNNTILSKMLWIMYYEVIVTHGLTSNISQFKATFKEGPVNNAIVWSAHSYVEDISGVKAVEGYYAHEVVGTDLRIYYQKTASTYDKLELNTMNTFSSIDYDGYHKAAFYNLGDEEFTIPVSWFVIEQMTAEEQLEAYQYILRLDVYALLVQELKWYETEAFLDLFQFVLVVISIITLGATSFIMAATQLAVNYAIAELVIWIAEQTGNAYLAALVGVVVGILFNNPSAFSDSAFMNAETLIETATEFVDTYSNTEGYIKQQEFEESMEEAQDLMDAKQAEYAEGRDNMTDMIAITPDLLISTDSPDTNIKSAINGQYEYNQLYNYDSLVADFYDINLSTGAN
ncbi:MAG: hypothetical protein GY820_10530 [Gammaproteobacteria bacterium]|nr:hypothetical protein [Gammaproteobacteria bacterium]